MIRVVLDTNVLVAARRSMSGASSRLLEAVVAERFTMLISVPLLLEYEAVLLRPEQLDVLCLEPETATEALDYLIGYAEPVWIDFRWRPQSGDPADDMVLETAINGRANYIVTFNEKDFAAALRFGIRVETPGRFLEIIS